MTNIDPQETPKNVAYTDNVSMEDFIFGTLSTDELRLKEITTAKRGLAHEFRLSPLDPKPGKFVTIEASAGPNAPVNEMFLHCTTNGSIPDLDNGTTISMTRTRTEWDTLLWGYVQHFACELPPQPEGVTVRYRISGVTHDDQRLWVGSVHSERQIFSFTIDYHHVPEWINNAVIYHIFMDRFAPTPGMQFADHTNLGAFFGGTLRGVLSKLDYITELGANVLWLSPIFPSPSHHGYDSTSFGEIEPRFGTREDFKVLVDEMHRRGMRIILDFVPNHVSNEHDFFRSASTDPDSPYRDYFTFIRWPDFYQSFFGVETLPQINNENHDARRYVIDSAVQWMRDYGVDGFRLDYAYGPSHDFWTDYYRAVKAANPDSYHFGEIVETPQFLRTYEGRMDGTLDFNFLQQVRKLFAFGTATPGEFDQFLTAHEAFFGGLNFTLPSFLDNHDMNRFLWVVRGDKRKLMQAAVCQFTLHAPPIIYYGTEIGLSQLRDIRQGTLGILEESRLPMPWGDEQDRTLYDFYKWLIKLRQDTQALRTGSRSTWLVDNKRGLYGYNRYLLGREIVLVCFNLSGDAQMVDLPAGIWQNAWNGQSLTGNVEIPAYGFLVGMQG